MCKLKPQGLSVKLSLIEKIRNMGCVLAVLPCVDSDGKRFDLAVTHLNLTVYDLASAGIWFWVKRVATWV